jgi:hypothetical protein
MNDTRKRGKILVNQCFFAEKQLKLLMICFYIVQGLEVNDGWCVALRFIESWQDQFTSS